MSIPFGEISRVPWVTTIGGKELPPVKPPPGVYDVSRFGWPWHEYIDKWGRFIHGEIRREFDADEMEAVAGVLDRCPAGLWGPTRAALEGVEW